MAYAELRRFRIFLYEVRVVAGEHGGTNMHGQEERLLLSQASIRPG